METNRRKGVTHLRAAPSHQQKALGNRIITQTALTGEAVEGVAQKLWAGISSDPKRMSRI